MDRRSIKKFQTLVWNFYKKNKRTLPWRATKDPYKILVSEVMLQQTQADRVVAYYKKWITRFPNFTSLAGAKFSEIYPYWQGLGYNRRALALQKLAKEVVKKYHGKLPLGIRQLEELPGIGPYTARAVSIFAFNRPLTCIETNIRRVFIHHFFEDTEVVSDEEILPLMELMLPTKKSRAWHWALMDYGAYLKSTIPNPNRRHSSYRVQPKFEGSLRQIRGSVLRALSKRKLNLEAFIALTQRSKKDVLGVLKTLQVEGFIGYDTKSKTYYLS